MYIYSINSMNSEMNTTIQLVQQCRYKRNYW